jgi:hypothetical protein
MPTRSARRWCGFTAFAFAVVAALLSTVAIRAHEAGTTQVSVVLRDDRTYDIEVVTDAGALLEKLNALADKPAPGGPGPSALQAQLTAFDEDFRTRVKVAFDGVEVRPSITYAVGPGTDATSPPVATMHLTGAAPAGAQHVTWSFGWTFTSYTLAVRHGSDGTPMTESLEGNRPSAPIELRASAPVDHRLEVARRYLTLGFTHIVPLGIDHVLFVLGIVLLSSRPRTMLAQVTAFTVAHSLALALGIYGIVAVPSDIIQPLIALSIAYVALENIRLSELKPRRVAIVFAFGLVHGLGFAGALRDVGLPSTNLLTALLTFNLGLETGQLFVIGVAFLLLGYHWSNRAWYRGRVVVPVSALIACTAVYWTIERLPL